MFLLIFVWFFVVLMLIFIWMGWLVVGLWVVMIRWICCLVGCFLWFSIVLVIDFMVGWVIGWVLISVDFV